MLRWHGRRSGHSGTLSFPVLPRLTHLLRERCSGVLASGERGWQRVHCEWSASRACPIFPQS